MSNIMDNKQPELNKKAFICPHCMAFSAMTWETLCVKGFGSTFPSPSSQAKCHQCEKVTIWLNGDNKYPIKLLYPNMLTAPFPNEDMPEICKKDYNEAREIAHLSPKGAAALLRLCVQNLIITLGGKGHNINDDIHHLVKSGLSIKIQQTLDCVRVIGNNAVHPGEINFEDNAEIVNILFPLINLIVDSQISQPKEINLLFQGLPEKAKKAISKRDVTVKQ